MGIWRIVNGAVRWGSRLLWALTFVTAMGLLLRIGVMLRFGVGENGAAPTTFAGTVYQITSPVVSPFGHAAGMSMPLNGLPHVFDIAAVLGIVVISFGVLAITKIADAAIAALKPAQEAIEDRIAWDMERIPLRRQRVAAAAGLSVPGPALRSRMTDLALASDLQISHPLQESGAD